MPWHWLTDGVARRALLLSLLVLPLPVLPAEFSGYLVLTTDYVWRGVTQSNGDPAVQAGGDVAFNSGLYFGVWGSTIDIDNGPQRKRDLEVNYYLGYGRELNDQWTLTGNVVAYTYPGQVGSVDYNYEEVSVSANFDDMLWFEYAYSPDLYNTGKDTHNIEVYGDWSVSPGISVGAGAGYYDVSSLTGDSFTYWQGGITWIVGALDVDLRYHDTSRWVRIVSSEERTGARVVLSLRLAF